MPTNPVQQRVQELVRFTQQLQRVHPNVLAKALSRGIVHQDSDLVVINKPYGVPVHGKEHVGKGGRPLLPSATIRGNSDTSLVGSLEALRSK